MIDVIWMKSLMYVILVMLVLVGGIFAATTCSENDRGNDMWVKGTTKLFNPDGSLFNSADDNCMNSTTVKEFSCDLVHGGWNIAYLDCPSGYVCTAGACVARTPVYLCSETDGGYNLSKKGESKLFSDSTLISSGIDYCDGNKVHEYWCRSNSALVTGSSYDCPEGQVCSDGACVEAYNTRTCSETDGGNYKYTKGTATLRNSDGTVFNTMTDSCRDTSTVTEVTCSTDGHGWSISYEGCPNGYSCTDGACVATPTTSTPVCADSDSGSNIYRKGTVEFVNSVGTRFTAVDECIATTNMVREFYCPDAHSGYTSTNTPCPTGYACNDGACVANNAPEYRCVDADGGEDIYTASNAKAYRTSDGSLSDAGYDQCLANGKLYEAYCSSTGRVGQKELACPTGYTCSAGACVANVVPGATCTETDGGKNYYRAGSATGKLYSSGVQDTWKDSCTVVLAGAETQSSQYIKEFWCQDNQVYLYYDTCPSGYTCLNGACVANTTASAEYRCVDGDSGENLYVASNAKAYRTSDGSLSDAGYDQCLANGKLYEAYCSSTGRVGQKELACPTGYTCSAGACVSSTPTTGTIVTFEVGVNNYPDVGSSARSSRISGWVNEYKVTPVSAGVYTGVLVETKKATERVPATFAVYPTQIVDFVGFKSYAAARAATTWTFSSPPYKNFGDAAETLCQINYLDTTTKMRIAADGSYSCATSLSVPYQPSNLTDATDDGTSSNATDETPPLPPVTGGTYSYTVNLKSGWNLVSVPVKGTADAVSSALVTATTCSSPKMYVYDPATNNYVTSGYGLDVNDKVPVPYAFWVKVSSPCKVAFVGDYQQMYYDSWKPREGAGWVAIGGPYSPSPVSWSSISGGCTATSGPWEFDNSANSWKRATQLKAGDGYFVKVGASCVLGADVPPLPPS